MIKSSYHEAQIAWESWFMTILLGWLYCPVLGENTRITVSVAEEPWGISQRLHPVWSSNTSFERIFAVTKVSTSPVFGRGSFLPPRKAGALSKMNDCRIFPTEVSFYCKFIWVLVWGSKMLPSGLFVVGNSAFQGPFLHKHVCWICLRTGYDI